MSIILLFTTLFYFFCCNSSSQPFTTLNYRSNQIPKSHPILKNTKKLRLELNRTCIDNSTTLSKDIIRDEIFTSITCLQSTLRNSKIMSTENSYIFYANIKNNQKFECIKNILDQMKEKCIIDIDYELEYERMISYNNDICNDQDLNKNNPCAGIYYHPNDYPQFDGSSSCANENYLWHLSYWSPYNNPNDLYTYVDASNSNNNIDIWILDSGIDSTHSEFDNIQIIRRETSNSDPLTWGSHGTHVASIAGGNYAGIAKNFRLFDCPVCRGQYCGGEYIENCLDDIRSYYTYNSNRRAVINLSLGSQGSNSGWNGWLLELESLGIVTVAAAGNDNIDVSGFSPASSNYVISVGSHDWNFKRSSFSNYGSGVEIYAPGHQILAAYDSASTPYGRGNSNFYTFMWGTSMAAPVISGEVALLLSRDMSLTRQEIVSILQNRGNQIQGSNCPYGDPCRMTSGYCNTQATNSFTTTTRQPTYGPTKRPTSRPTDRPTDSSNSAGNNCCITTDPTNSYWSRKCINLWGTDEASCLDPTSRGGIHKCQWIC